MDVISWETAAGKVLWGQVTLAACFILYLVWWCVFFWPVGERPQGGLRVFGIACIVGAVVLGVAGIAISCTGIAQVPTGEGHGLRTWWIALGGMLAYALLFFFTVVVLVRDPTTELVIIVGWATLELAAVNALHASGTLGGAATVVLLVVMAVLFVLSLVCYLRYYQLTGWIALIDGAVPLLGGIVYAAVLCGAIVLA